MLTLKETSEFYQLLLRLLPSIISINYTDFHNFLGEHTLQNPVGKSRLTAPFLPQPPTSQNKPLTIKLIETPNYTQLNIVSKVRKYKLPFSSSTLYFRRAGGNSNISNKL